MLNQQTLHKLYGMRLNGMADAFRQQLEQPDLGGLSFEERLGSSGAAAYGAGKKTAPWHGACAVRD